jgi:hypothetical protein
MPRNPGEETEKAVKSFRYRAEQERFVRGR